MRADSHRICLTPTRNEAWILRPFLAAAQLWADHIVVADQNSTDGTWEMLDHQSSVERVRNDSPTYDEAARQRLLIDRARHVPGRRVLIALDADEALSANVVGSPDWQRIEEAAPGTVIRFRWVNVLPDFKRAWIPANRIPCGFVDDGSEHTGTSIHSCRIPWAEDAPVLDLDDIVVLHFQYTVWERMLAKQRWYQAWERINHPSKGALQIFRQYNHMFGAWDRAEIQPLRGEWLEGFAEAGADYRALRAESVTWWDREIVDLLRRHGADHFRKIAIWDKDWREIAAQLDVDATTVSDPRTSAERVVHRLLAWTQGRRDALSVRALERVLRFANW